MFGKFPRFYQGCVAGTQSNFGWLEPQPKFLDGEAGA